VSCYTNKGHLHNTQHKERVKQVVAVSEFTVQYSQHQ